MAVDGSFNVAGTLPFPRSFRSWIRSLHDFERVHRSLQANDTRAWDAGWLQRGG
jgi:hypothetical protein